MSDDDLTPEEERELWENLGITPRRRRKRGPLAQEVTLTYRVWLFLILIPAAVFYGERIGRAIAWLLELIYS
jgi:hypothetical protein